MPRDKIPSRWKKIRDRKNLPKLKTKRESRRTSIKIPKKEDSGSFKCSHKDWERLTNPTRQPMRPGKYDQLLPDRIYNYKSQWARYERSLEIEPFAIQEVEVGNSTETHYKFESCDSLTGFWTVKVKNSGATFIDGNGVLNIFCPKPIDLEELDWMRSDGEEFEWIQLSGDRFVFVDPPTALEPTLTITGTIIDNSPGADELPIIMRVFPVGQPDLFYDLIIFTTPTSYHFGHSVTTEPTNYYLDCEIVKEFLFKPTRANGGKCDKGSPLTINWQNPPCEQQNLVRFVWQSNTTGQYVDLDYFFPGDDYSFTLQRNRHYRLLAEYEYKGATSIAPSAIIYLQHDSNFQPNQVFAESTNRGTSVTQISTAFNKIVLLRVVRTVTSNHSGLSVQQTKTSFNKINLITIFKTVTSTHGGLSVAQAETSFTKINLGGIVIG